LSLFSFLLHENLEKALGELPFANLAFQLISKIVQFPKKIQTPPPSPDPKLVQVLSKSYIERLAFLFFTKIYRKSPDIKKHCQHFVDVCEREQFRLITPINLLVNVLFLRCINLELAEVSRKLRESRDSQHGLLAGYLMGISKSITATANDNAQEKVLHIISTSLLSPEDADLKEIETFIKSIHI
jgi:hypothetical protein